MTKAQEAWMASHPDYQPITSWCGPYADSGVLYENGTFALGNDAELKARALIVGRSLTGAKP